jgi:TfoX/Sxy family transcriptional regulator of competence genes
MAYDERLAGRVAELLGEESGVEERKMFGGLAFLVGGHMACGVEKNRLMLRIGAENYEEALSQPHVRPMDFTGRPLRGFVYVEPEGLRTKPQLARWVRRAVAFARSQPPKSSPKRSVKKGRPKRAGSGKE